MQNNGVKDKREGLWQDIGAAMEVQAGQQGVKPQTKDDSEGRNEKITGSRIYAIVRLNGFRCAMSGLELDPDNASLDHIKPLSRGGTHTLDNVHVIHSTVNRMKGEMDQAEFVRWCKLIAQWNG